ncbi:MAG: cytochrome c biogenesis protein ResB [Azoarcus sp.]|jgi:cytochrome c biogenesis protein|nr:cytochrome c biogenesis protein ResB [Azoarcus sp.]
MQRAAARASILDALIELLSSMRFAISLLTILAIASVAGMVVRQNEPANAYLNQFGQFWDAVFSSLGLYSVYNAGWFIIILAFLVLSTTLCIVRQFSPMLREIRGFREHAREVSLQNFTHRESFSPTLPPEARRSAVTGYLAGTGFRFRVDEREGCTLVAAKQGSAGRIGYFFAHSAIVLICIGGLLDGNLPFSLKMRLEGKAPSDSQTIAGIPPSARLDKDNWSYRGNVYIPEGGSTDFATINVDGGVLLQPLPFKITLKRFYIEHYASGMPKRYASDIIITDTESGENIERTLEVNKPFEYRGISLFQSGFDDGGSRLSLTVRSLVPNAHPPFPLVAEVGSSLSFDKLGYLLGVEITEFKPINVEDMSVPDQSNSFIGSGTQTSKNLNELGPSYTFRLRDKAGQATEFRNYMRPIDIGMRKYMISGVRKSPMEDFKYLRIPLDGDADIAAGFANTWFSIRRFFFDPEQRATLIERFVARNIDADEKDKKTMRERLKATAEHTLALYAHGGLDAVSGFIEKNISEKEEERERAGTAFIQILQGLTFDAWMLTRKAAGLNEFEPDEAHAPFIRDTFIALTDSLAYGAPFYLQLTEYEQRQASILQATRSPGKPLVYLGSLLLALGVFAMLYIRERRLFVLLKEDTALVAMSSNRKTIDLDEAFARHRDTLAAVLGASIPRGVDLKKP